MATSPSQQIPNGTVVDGRYEITGFLGGGGYGAVYRARQRNMDREVALKVIHPHLAHEPLLVKRFLREARAVSRLKNPHIVHVFDSGQTPEGVLYLVMELIEGRTLKAIFKQEAPLEPTRLCRLLSQVCEALAEAHSYQAPGSDKPTPIVHRDLKPENVLVSQTKTGSEHCYLVDFGIVRMEEDAGELDVSLTGGLAIGTPQYMSPEQGFGEKPGPAADLWALGVLLYQGLSAALPFTGNSAHMVVAAVTRDPPKPLQAAPGQPALPPELVALVDSLLQKDPAARPADAQTVQRTLLGFANPGTPFPGMTPHPGLAPMRAASGRQPVVAADLHATLALHGAGKPPNASHMQPIVLGIAAVVAVAVGLGAWWALRTPTASTNVATAPASTSALEMAPAAPLPAPDAPANAPLVAPAPPSPTAPSSAATPSTAVSPQVPVSTETHRVDPPVAPPAKAAAKPAAPRKDKPVRLPTPKKEAAPKIKLD